MSNKPIELKATKGVRNDVSSERFEFGDLLAGVNIEIDETGKVSRRLGTSAPIVSGNMHSPYADLDGAYVVKDGVLSKLDMTTLAATPLVTVRGRVRYVRVADSLFWTDGTQTGELTVDGNRTCGIVPPDSFDATVVTGNFRAGKYLFTMTFVRSDGTESGAPAYAGIELPADSGIAFNNMPVSTDATVVEKRLYISAWNGELPLLTATLTNSDVSTAIYELPNQTVPVRTSLMQNMPAGQVIGYYNGRLYVAENNYLWYSQPYEYGLVNPMENFIGFSSPVKTFAPVSDGIYVGSDDETVFLEGADPAEFKRRQVASYGTILGTETVVPGYYVGTDGVPGMTPAWMSTRGLCLGLNSGELKNLTGSRYILPSGVSQGASLLKVRGGTPQLVTSLF